MKHSKKILLLFFVLLLICSYNSMPKAASIYDGKTIYKEPSGGTQKQLEEQTIDTMIKNADAFVEKENSTIVEGNLQELSSLIFYLLSSFAVGISVVVGIIIGINFLTGSVEQKADAKKLLVPYGVGCLVVFGALGIWVLAVQILQNV